MTRARDILKLKQRLEEQRRPFEPVWQDVAELTSPVRVGPREPHSYMPSTSHNKRIHDSTAPESAAMLAAALWSWLTNSASTWMTLRHTDPAVDDHQPARAWLDQVSAIMLAAFAPPSSFYNEALSLYLDYILFGTACMLVEDRPGRGLAFSTRHLREIFLGQDAHQGVDTVVRVFDLTARQALAVYGDDVPDDIRQAEDRSPDHRFQFVHACLPAEDWDGDTPRGRPIASVTVAVQGEHVVREAGYFEMPYLTPRWSSSARTPYGDGHPGFVALPDIKTVNAVARSNLLAVHKALDPVLLAHDEVGIRGMSAAPGSIIHGAVTDTGQPRVLPVNAQAANLASAVDYMERLRTAIRTAFWRDRLALPNDHRMTAFEVARRTNENLLVNGAVLGRLEFEFLSMAIARVYGILSRAGAFPPPPPVLQQYPDLRVQYLSPLERAQEANEAEALAEALSMALPLAQADPSAVKHIDIGECMRTILRGRGAPARVLRDRQTVAREIQAERQQAQQMAVAQAAPGVAGAARQGVEALAGLVDMQSAETNTHDQRAAS